MKFLVVLSVALACAAADGPEVLRSEGAAPILKQTFDITPEGQFAYSYETGNGIAAQAEGTLELINQIPSETIQGGYKYIAPDGSIHEVIYKADSNGYQPASNDIPTPPPVPEGILRALAWLAEHPPQPIKP